MDEIITINKKRNEWVFVTGIAGFIGFHVARRLINDGFNVVGIDNLNDYYDVNLKVARLSKLGIRFDHDSFHNVETDSLHFLYSDLSLESWNRELDAYNISFVIHLAAQAGVRHSILSPKDYLFSNLMGFQNIIDYCVMRKISKLVYASSSSVYGNDSSEPFNESESCTKPVSFYAATKRCNELVAFSYFHTKNISSVGLRFFTVYGPWGRPDMAPMLFADALRLGTEVNIFNHGNQMRDFTYIDDIVNGVLLTMESLRNDNIIGAEVMNIGYGKPNSLMRLIELIENAYGKKIKKNFVDAQIGDVSSTYADITKISSLANYKSKVPLNKGLSEFISWYKDYYVV